MRSVGKHTRPASRFADPFAPRARGAHRAPEKGDPPSWRPGTRWSAVVVTVIMLLGGFTVAASSAATTTQSLWSNSVVPRSAADPEVAKVELGTKFHSTVSGTVKALRLYRFSSTIGPSSGTLWDSRGRKLASVN